MSQPEEPQQTAAVAPQPPGAAAAPIATVALYALGMAGAAILLLAGLSVLTLSAGWDAGSFAAATAAVTSGLAAGFAVARRLAASLRASSMLAVAAAATGLAALLAAAGTPAGRSLHRALWPLFGGRPAGAWLLDLGLAASLLVLPVLCFAAMPAAFSRLLGAERPGALGYTLGATFAGLGLGVALGGIVLLPVLGTQGSLFVAVALLGLAAGGAVLTGRLAAGAGRPAAAVPAGTGPEPSPLPAARPGATAPVFDAAGGGALSGSLTALLVGLSGWGGMLCWSRSIGLIAGPTGPGDATVMAVFLLGLGLGAVAVGALRVRPTAAALSGALAAAAALVAASSFLVTPAAVLYLKLVAHAEPAGLFSPAGALIALLLVLPSAAVLGGLLTLLPPVLAAGRSRRELFATGRVSAALLCGALCGDLLFRLVLVPGIGLRRSLSAAAAGAALAAIAALRAGRDLAPAARTTWTLTLAGLLLVVAAFPASWDPQVVVSAPYRYGARGVERLGSVQEYLAARRTTTPVYYHEGMNATVMAERRLQSDAGGQPFEALQLTVDGRVLADNLADLRTQVLQAHLPLLLHGEARSVLLAGYGAGVTAGSILTHPIESLLVVEEEAAMFGVEPLFGPYSNSPLADPRLSRVVASPRAFLRADRAQYDAILLSAPAPWLPSDAALATLEGYAEMKARLRPGGLLAQRITLSTVNAKGAGSILRTFAAAFDEVLLLQIAPEDLLLIGASVPLRFDDARMRNEIAAREAVVGDLSRALTVGVNDLLMAVRLEGGALRDLVGGGPLNRDDRSTAALEALRDMRIHDNTILLGAIDDAGRDALLKVLVNYGEGTEAEAGFLYSLAKTYLGLAADPERARAIADRLAALGETARAAWVRGEAHLQQADYDAALREWEGIVAAQPDFLDALFSLGVFHLERRDHFAAERYLAPAARLHPEASIVLYQHGRNLFYLERYGEAIETLERARGAAGAAQRYPLIDYLAGVSALRLKRAKEAERSLRAYLDWAYAQDSLTVLEAEAHDRLADVYELLGEPMKARDERGKGMNLRVEMREFASRRAEAGGSPGTSGLTLPNPASDRPGEAPPAGAPATPPPPADKPHDP